MPLSYQDANHRYIERRHWHRQSCPYAGADQLLYLLEHDWMIERVHYKYTYYGTRQAIHYLFKLRRDEVIMLIYVIGNPFIERLVQQHHDRVVLPLEVRLR